MRNRFEKSRNSNLRVLWKICRVCAAVDELDEREEKKE